jgi:hypothetical protein
MVMTWKDIVSEELRRLGGANDMPVGDLGQSNYRTIAFTQLCCALCALFADLVVFKLDGVDEQLARGLQSRECLGFFISRFAGRVSG